MQFLVTVGNLPITLLNLSGLSDPTEGRAKGIRDIVLPGSEIVNIFAEELDRERPFVEWKRIEVVGDAGIGDEQLILVHQCPAGRHIVSGNERGPGVAVVRIRDARRRQAFRTGDAQTGNSERRVEMLTPL